MEGFGLDGGGIKGCAEVRATPAQGGHLAVLVLTNEAGGYIDFCAVDGFRYPAVSFGQIVLYNKLPGIQPFGLVALLAKFCGKDGGGKKLSKCYLLLLGGLFQRLEKGIYTCLDGVSLFSGEEPLDYGPVALLHGGNGLCATVKEGIRAAADGTAHQYHGTFLRLFLHYIQDAGHSRCTGYGTAAEF